MLSYPWSAKPQSCGRLDQLRPDPFLQSRAVKAGLSQPRISKKYDARFVTFRRGFLFIICLPFSFEFEKSQATQNKASEKHF